MNTFVNDIVNGEICSKKRKLLTDALSYKNPCKIRQKIFDFINEIPEQYWIDHDSAHARSIKRANQCSRVIPEDLFNDNTIGTVRDIKIRLIDMINKYDNIDNNEEDIWL